MVCDLDSGCEMASELDVDLISNHSPRPSLTPSGDRFTSCSGSENVGMRVVGRSLRNHNITPPKLDVCVDSVLGTAWIHALVQSYPYACCFANCLARHAFRTAAPLISARLCRGARLQMTTVQSALKPWKSKHRIANERGRTKGPS